MLETQHLFTSHPCFLNTKTPVITHHQAKISRRLTTTNKVAPKWPPTSLDHSSPHHNDCHYEALCGLTYSVIAEK
ncbi:hypothetical protein JTE90_010685 [Oedothorax gibbosus]|uniref:Uncharacterized protein n=1 Tax=Oedothorax gibbosus TaxID=931172 RepID=A0AAV6UTA7_9ARAC|nr:hypothetical protein JTE90_010685 [Oedothorax gibbosus]